jgi:hypothetical protein
MFIVYRDPRGISGREIYELDCSISIQENIARVFPHGLDANTALLRLNGQQINPLQIDLSRKATRLDFLEIIIRQQGTGLLVGLIVAVVAAVAVYVLMPKPTIPNNLGAQKDSPNNSLTGQTNIARLYQAIPDIYGRVRVFPDLVEPSLIEYKDNIKTITELMCIGKGNYVVENMKYADTLLSTINGASHEVFSPSEVIPMVYTAVGSPDVDGQEITPPNLGDIVLYAAETTNVISLNYSGTVATIRIVKSQPFDYFYDKSKPINVRLTVDATYLVANSNGSTSQETGRFTLSGSLAGMGISDDGAVTNAEEYYDISINNISPSSSFPTGGIVQSTYLKLEDMEALYVGPFIMAAPCDQIWFNVTFPRGLQGRAEFIAEWWQVDVTNDVIPGTQGSYTFWHSDGTYEPQYRTHRITPSVGRGRYAFRVVRTNNGSDQLTDQAKLEEVYAIQARRNVWVYDTLVRVVTRATEQATGIKERKFNAEVTRKTIYWNGNVVVHSPRASRDFADAVLHSFINIANRRGEQLDIESLYAIGDSIKQSNERLGWFDFSFDDKDISLGQRLQTICNAARVTVFRDGLKWRFTRDEKKDFVAAQFDARNLANDNDSGTLQFKGHLPTSYDGVELEWVDSSDTNQDGTDKKAYIRLRIDAVNKKIIVEPASRPLKIQLAGCRNYDQAMNRAQLEARRLIYQRRYVEDTALSDAWIVQIGDRVRWADVYDEAISNGEILEINGDVFTTSETLAFEKGVNYRVSITDKYGYPSEWLTVAGVSGQKNAFTADFSTAFTADNINSMLGSRFILVPAVATAPQEFILTGKPSGDDPLKIKISLAQYDERMYAFDK